MTTTTMTSTSSKEDSYEIGDFVLAESQDSKDYLPGKIKRQHRNGTYTIEFENETIEKYIPIQCIKRRSSSVSSSITYEINQQILVNRSSQWIEASITRVHRNGTYTIEYIDTGKKETRIPVKRMKPLEKTKRKQDQEKDEQDEKDSKEDDEEDEEEENEIYQRNDIVFIKDGKEWKKGMDSFFNR